MEEELGGDSKGGNLKQSNGELIMKGEMGRETMEKRKSKVGTD